MLPVKVYETVLNALDTATNAMLDHKTDMENEDYIIYKRMLLLIRKTSKLGKKAHVLRIKSKTTGLSAKS
jgi:hypothetical protein